MVGSSTRGKNNTFILGRSHDKDNPLVEDMNTTSRRRIRQKKERKKKESKTSCLALSLFEQF